MMTIPEKLLGAPFVRLLHQSKDTVLLHKKLSTSLHGRQNYLGRHAISWVVQGQQQIQTNEGEQLSARSGQLLCLKKGLYTIHDLISQQGQFESYLLFLEEKSWAQLFSQTATAEHIPHSFAIATAPPYLQLFWQSVEYLSKLANPNAAHILEAKAQELFAVLQTEKPELWAQLGGFAQQQPKSLYEFMQDNFDKSLTLKDYAYLSGRSESTFRREFRQRFGTTPRKWITHRRMQKAQELLQIQAAEVSEVALSVGYESVSHFISEFKKYHGHTPGQLLRTSWNQMSL